VLSLGLDGTVRRWISPHVFDEHEGWVNDVDVSTDGSLLVTAGSEGHAFLLDSDHLSKTAAPVPGNSRLTAVRFDPTDRHRVVTHPRYGETPELWRWGSGGTPERILTYEKPPLSANAYLSSLAISPHGLLVASMDTLGTVHLWDARTGALPPG
jgi:WD40 repeat protein